MSVNAAKFVFLLFIAVQDCIQSYKSKNFKNFYIHLVFLLQTLGLGLIILAIPALDAVAPKRAVHLAVLIGSPCILTSMLLRCFLCYSFDLIFLPPLAMTAIAAASVYLLFYDHDMPVLAYLPGITLICIFCYGIGSTTTEKFLCSLYICITCLCILSCFYYHSECNLKNVIVSEQLVACGMALVLLNFGFADWYDRLRVSYSNKLN